MEPQACTEGMSCPTPYFPAFPSPPGYCAPNGYVYIERERGREESKRCNEVLGLSSLRLKNVMPETTVRWGCRAIRRISFAPLAPFAANPMC